MRLPLLRTLGWYGEPIGFRLTIGELVYEVVGVLEDEEFRGLTRQALAAPVKGQGEVYAPYGAVLDRMGTMSYVHRSGSMEASNVEINQIVVEAESEEQVLAVSRMIRAVLERFHDTKDWEIVVPLELLEQRKRAQQVLGAALLAIAGISLLVGGIGIANIMLATVTERTREIGVRRAIGAKRRHIGGQFLTETVLLSAAGGVIGVLIGAAGTVAVGAFTQWEARFTYDVALLAMGVSCAVGVLSGLFPAWRASRLDPIQALRCQWGRHSCRRGRAVREDARRRAAAHASSSRRRPPTDPTRSGRPPCGSLRRMRGGGAHAGRGGAADRCGFDGASPRPRSRNGQDAEFLGFWGPSPRGK